MLKRDEVVDAFHADPDRFYAAHSRAKPEIRP